MTEVLRREIEHVERLRVSLELEGRSRLVGDLAWSRRERKAYFEYASSFLSDPLPISPFRLPARPGLHEGAQAFEGLHGVFADSLPDGWGRKLLDRRLKSAGFDERVVTPIDRLAYVGRRGMGALTYVPEIAGRGAVDGVIDLDWLSEEARRVENDALEIDISKLVEAQGGSGGARPKIVVAYAPVDGRLRIDRGQPLPPDFEHWLVKFRSVNDPREIGTEEYAYALMAKGANIEMPEVRLLRTGDDAYFAIKRFDRSPVGRHHVHTAAGLIDADYRVAGSMDYEALLSLTWSLTKNKAHVLQMFRRMVFNVLAHNRDDHPKNHTFAMTPAGAWAPSPAYDITYSNGPGGEHNLAVAGEGRSPGKLHILEAAKRGGVTPKEALEIFEEIRTVVNSWPDYAMGAGLSTQRTRDIDSVLNGRRPSPRRRKKDDQVPATSPSWP
jgi:serine/threonine-protein kinase HipA